MEIGGSFDYGDLPEDPEGREEGADGPMRGWLPPEDRLWRHPSEVADAGVSSHVPPLLGIGGRGWHRTRRTATAVSVVGVAAVAATVAVALAVIDTPSTTTAPTAGHQRVVSTTAMTTSVLGHDVTALAQAVRPSLVALEPVGGHSAVRTTGVVLPGGKLVLTAASAVTGASQFEVLAANGRRHRGRVVGTDAGSGVAVIATDGGLDPATFADENVEPGDMQVMTCLCTPAAGVGMVTEVGSGVSLDGGPNLVDAIEAEMPLGPTSGGGVMLDGEGRIIGILDGQMNTGGDTLGVFVPAPLAESVALELAQSHRVDHGWLGIVCRSGSGTSGVTVTGFLPGSPAAGAGLRVGDVLVAIDGHAVESVTDVQDRLYSAVPGSTVQVTVQRGTVHAVVPVRLSGRPAT